jgi:ubiquinone/menaquinone biosynthesis C-methylase UbiE
MASGYEQERFGNRIGRWVGNLEKRRMLAGLKRLGVAPNAVVLDVPAGTGRLTSSTIDAGYRAIGMDVSSAMLREGFTTHQLDSAQEFLGAASGDIENIPLRGRSVDAVLSLRLMGHLPPATKEQAIREILRVTRVGAVVMFSRRTAFLRLKRQMFWRLGVRRAADRWYDETDTEIRALIIRAGGEVLGHSDVLGPLAESRAYVIRPRSH